MSYGVEPEGGGELSSKRHRFQDKLCDSLSELYDQLETTSSLMSYKPLDQLKYSLLGIVLFVLLLAKLNYIMDT